MDNKTEMDIVRLQERIGGLEKTIISAHTRIDGLNEEVKAELDEISKDVKELLANMHQARGGKAAWIIVGSLGVGLIGALAKIFFR